MFKSTFGVFFADNLQIIDQNQAAYDFHHNTEYYNASSKVLAELVAEPTDVKKITPFAGFASR